MDLTESPSTRLDAQGVPISSFNQNAIKHKTTLLNLAAELGNVSKACKLMGFSRDTCYHCQIKYDLLHFIAAIPVMPRAGQTAREVFPGNNSGCLRDTAMAYNIHPRSSIFIRHMGASRSLRPHIIPPGLQVISRASP